MEATTTSSSMTATSRPYSNAAATASLGYGDGDGNTTSSSGEEVFPIDKSIELTTYVCAGVSIATILLTLLSYVGYRKFNVKRPHIIMVNLCVTLLLYFISYVISNPSRHLVPPSASVEEVTDSSSGDDVEQKEEEDERSYMLCVFGAFFCHVSLLSTWLWLTAYWFILLIMYRKPVGGHVSHFVFKSALPCYGIPLLVATLALLIAALNGDLQRRNDLGYASNACFVANQYLYVGLVLPFVIAGVPVGGIFVAVACGISRVKRADGDTRHQQRHQHQHTMNGVRRVKSHLVKLTIITTLVALLVVDSAVIPIVRKLHSPGVHKQSLILAVMFSVISIGLGILLLYLFCIRQEDVREYWVEVMLGSKLSFRERPSLSHASASNSVVAPHKRHSLGRHDESYRLHPGYGSEKSPMHNKHPHHHQGSARIIPKQDTDLTALDLDQIPGTPNPTPTPPRKQAPGTKEDATNGTTTGGTTTEERKSGISMRQLSSSSSESSKRSLVAVSSFDDSSVVAPATTTTAAASSPPRNGTVEWSRTVPRATTTNKPCVSLQSSRDSVLEVTEFV